jgi:hypothetical protein
MNTVPSKRKHIQLKIIDDTANQIIGMFESKKFRESVIKELIIDHIGYDMIPILESPTFCEMFGKTHFDYRRYKFSHTYEYATVDNWDIKLKCEMRPILSGVKQELINIASCSDESEITYPNNISLHVVQYDGNKYPQIVFTNPQQYINILVRPVLNHTFMNMLKEINLIKSNTKYIDGDMFVLIVGRYAPKGNLPFEKIVDIFQHCGVSIMVKNDFF